MEPIKPPKTFKVYTVLKQTGLSMTYVYGSSSSSSVTFGPGFFGTREEAEHNRTLELLKETSGAKYHVFELEIPNPTYQE